uniref:Uncharacterized protein n=1 Tax=Oryza barthii TaxID=65489 RepID=A0A0D3HVD0_9ORYZ
MILGWPWENTAGSETAKLMKLAWFRFQCWNAITSTVLKCILTQPQARNTMADNENTKVRAVNADIEDKDIILLSCWMFASCTKI